MASIDGEERERTLFCGNIHPKVTEEILYELFLQAGPLEKVKLVKNKNYAFITFRHSISVPYTIQLMNGIRLYQRPLLLQTRTGASGGLSQASMPNVNLLSSLPAAVTPLQFSNGSACLQTPVSTDSMPKVVQHDVINAPYHRSLSQPNFTLNRKSHRNETHVVHNSLGKTKLVPHHQNHRANLPYSRTSTPAPRFNKTGRNNYLTEPSVVPSSFHFHANMMNTISNVSWQNPQLAALHKF